MEEAVVHTTRPRRTRRRVLLAVVALLLVVLIGGVLYVMSDAGRTSIARYALGMIPLSDGYTLSVADTDGRLPSDLIVRDLVLSGPEGRALLHADSVALGIRVLPLLKRRVQLTHIRASDLTAEMNQDAGGSWDLIGAFPIDTASTGLSIRIGEALIHRAHVSARYFTAPTARDSILIAGPINISAHDIRMVDEYGGRVDSLDAPFTPAGLSTEARLTASASFFDQRLQLRHARLTSDRSAFDARGELSLDDATADLQATAAPLAFADLAPFLSSVDPRASVSGTVAVQRDSTAPQTWTASGDLDFGSAGRANLRGQWGRGDTLRYVLQADLTSLAPYVFLQSAFTSADKLTGTIGVNLSGPSNASLDGVANLTLTESALPSYDLGSTTLRATFSDGHADVNGRAEYAGSPVQVAGRITPFAQEPTYSLVASSDRLVIPSVRATLNGSVSVEGRGFIDAALVARPLLAQSRIGDLVIERAEGTVSYESGSGGMRGAGGTVSSGAGGTISGDIVGTATSGGFQIAADYAIADSRWVVRDAILRNLDVGALYGSPGTTVVSAHGRGSGVGMADGRFAISLDSVAAPGVSIGAGRISGTLDSGGVSLVDTMAINGGNLTANVRYVWPNERGLQRVRISDAQLDGIDVSTLPGAEMQTGLLTANVSGDFSFVDLASLNGTAEIVIDSSIINAVAVNRGQALAEFDAGNMRFQLEAATTAGSLTGSGTGQPFADPMQVNVTRLALSGVNIGAVASSSQIQTDLNGIASVQYVGGAQPNLDAALTMAPSRLNGQERVEGLIRARSSGDSINASWQLTWPRDGRTTGRIAATPDSLGTLGLSDLYARIEHVDVSAFWPSASTPTVFDTTRSDITLTARFDGRAASFDDLTGRLVVDSLAGTIADNAIRQGSLVAVAGGGRVDVEELVFATDAGNITGSGPLALGASGGESAFYLEIAADDLSLLGDLIPRTKRITGIGNVTASVVGPATATTVIVDGALGAIQYGENRASTIEVSGEALLDELRTVRGLDGSVRVANLLVGTAGFRDTRLTAAMADSLVEFDLTSEIDGRRDARISGTIDPRPDRREVRILGVNVRLDRDQWALLQPSTVSYGDAFRIRNLLLFTADQQIAVDGVIDLDGDQSLILTVEDFRIGSVADLLGYRGLDGTMNGYLDLEGPSYAPTMRGDLNVDLESYDKRVGDLELALAYDSLRLDVDGLLHHDQGGSMTFNGLLPVDLRLAQTRGPTQTGVRVAARQTEPDSDVDLTIVADSFSVGWILPFLDPAVYSRLDGIVNGQMNMQGTFAEPLMSGQARLTDGTVGLPLFGIDVTKASGNLLFEERNILIDNLTGQSGRGRMTAIGSIELTDLSLGQFDISIDLENFLAVDNADYRATTAGDLLIYGTTRQPVVSGYLRLESLDLYYKGAIEEFEPVTLTESDLRQVELVFGRRITASDTTTYDFYTALEIDINLEMTRDSWLRSYQNPRMDVPFYGSLDVLKQPAGEIEAFGTIDIVQDRGRIVELGRRFDIKSGTITYNGPIANPRIDLEAQYKVRQRGASGETGEDIIVSLLARGTLEDLDVTLSSEPAMETTDILSYVLVGRPARESLQFGGSEESLAADIALSQAAGFLEGLAGEELGLDVVRIEYEGTEVKLTAGKYLRSGIYVAISQPIVLNSEATQSASGSGTERELLLEVEIMRGLLARLQQQGTIFGINLFWQYAY